MGLSREDIFDYCSNHDFVPESAVEEILDLKEASKTTAMFTAFFSFPGSAWECIFRGSASTI